MKHFSRVLTVVALVAAFLASASFNPQQAQAFTTMNAVQTAEGLNHACAVLVSGEVLCWGSAPVTGIVPGISTAVEVASGANHDCALLLNQRVKCWGQNGSGQLGDGTNNNSNTPVDVVGVGGTGFLTGVVELQASAKRDVTCAVLTTGQARCWGSNGASQLGSTNGSNANTPQVVAVDYTGTAFTNIATIAVGSYVACLVKNDGGTYCWGSAGHGELGSAVTGSSQYPVQVAGIGGTGFMTDGSKLALADAMTCVVRTTGGVACWGLNNPGNGTSGGTSTPVAVSGVTNAVDVAAAEQNACLLLTDKTVKCWGTWHGSAGSGPTEQIIGTQLSPVSFGSLTNVVRLTGGGWPQHYCAVLATYEVRCWGANESGQLGRTANSPSYSNVPIEPQLTYTMGATTTTSTTSTSTTTTTTVAPQTTTTIGSGTTTTTAVAQTTTTVNQGQLSVPTIPKSTTTSVAHGLSTLSVSTTTTVPAPSTTPAPTTTAPAAPQVDAGKSAAIVNGKAVDAKMTRSDNQYVVDVAGTTATFSGVAKDGSRISLDASGTLRVTSEAQLRVSGSGFAPGAALNVWMYSTATRIGGGRADASGAYTGTFSIPAGLELGTHRLVVSGPNVSGDQVSIGVGILYGAAHKSSTMSRLLISIPIALAIAVGLLVPTTLRRRRKLA